MPLQGFHKPIADGSPNLRLAVVSPFVDRRHGTERAVAELLDRLAQKKDCEIHLYAERVQELSVDSPGVRREKGSGAIVWHKIPSIPGPHLVRFLSWFLLNSFYRAWDRRVRGLSFDLVLSPGINCLDADAVIVHALFHRLKELARGETGESAGPGLLRRFHRRAYYALLTLLERRIYSDPGVFLAAVSQRTAALLERYFHRGDVRIISNGVDTAQFSASARAALRAQARLRRKFQGNDIVLLLIGNDWRVKGLETVFRAVGALRELPFHILIAGEDSPERFRESARQLGILERCHFEGPRQDVLDFYAAADLYVSPSQEDSFGLPVAEAMACGLPVIASVQAGVATLIRDGLDGFILQDPGDYRLLSKIVERLRTDEALRRNVGEAGAKAAREWTWDRNAAEVWEFLREAAAKKRLAATRKGQHAAQG
jgi:UDP-glucose:(heptosyl)LPS alpha-1,3-glucosyltransferase